MSFTVAESKSAEYKRGIPILFELCKCNIRNLKPFNMLCSITTARWWRQNSNSVRAQLECVVDHIEMRAKNNQKNLRRFHVMHSIESVEFGARNNKHNTVNESKCCSRLDRAEETDSQPSRTDGQTDRQMDRLTVSHHRQTDGQTGGRTDRHLVFTG